MTKVCLPPVFNESGYRDWSKLISVCSRLRPPKKTRGFNPTTFLATMGDGRKILSVEKKQMIFAQGDAADAVFHVQKGKVRLTVVSKIGKEATIAIVGEGNFFGEGVLGRPASAYGFRGGYDRLRDSARR
jgi:CRP/FNR family cyclic AMP-dependent transcriptional regulator